MDSFHSTLILNRNRFDQTLRPREVQPAQNRFVLEGVYLYPEEQAEFSKKSFVLAMQRLLASARALASDGGDSVCRVFSVDWDDDVERVGAGI